MKEVIITKQMALSSLNIDKKCLLGQLQNLIDNESNFTSDVERAFYKKQIKNISLKISTIDFIINNLK